MIPLLVFIEPISLHSARATDLHGLNAGLYRQAPPCNLGTPQHPMLAVAGQDPSQPHGSRPLGRVWLPLALTQPRGAVLGAHRLADQMQKHCDFGQSFLNPFQGAQPLAARGVAVSSPGFIEPLKAAAGTELCCVLRAPSPRCSQHGPWRVGAGGPCRSPLGQGGGGGGGGRWGSGHRQPHFLGADNVAELAFDFQEMPLELQPVALHREREWLGALHPLCTTLHPPVHHLAPTLHSRCTSLHCFALPLHSLCTHLAPTTSTHLGEAEIHQNLALHFHQVHLEDELVVPPVRGGDGDLQATVKGEPSGGGAGKGPCPSMAPSPPGWCSSSSSRSPSSRRPPSGCGRSHRRPAW